MAAPVLAALVRGAQKESVVSEMYGGAGGERAATDEVYSAIGDVRPYCDLSCQYLHVQMISVFPAAQQPAPCTDKECQAQMIAVPLCQRTFVAIGACYTDQRILSFFPFCTYGQFVESKRTWLLADRDNQWADD